MKDEKYSYLVYRVYSEKERPRIPLNDRIVLYGWSSSKSIIKAFFEQRSKKKYKVKKVLEEDAYMHMGAELDPMYCIDYIDLKTSSTDETITLFMTKNELKEAQVAIHNYFSDLCRLVERDNGKMHLLELYINIDDYYLDPLQYIGFKPPELDILFDSVEYRESDDPAYDIEGLINSAYDSAYDVPHETVYHDGLIPGFSTLPSISDKILYSAESFIKVLKNDM